MLGGKLDYELLTGRIYDTAAWARTRKAQLKREPVCRVCADAGRRTIATTVAHIAPISQGGHPFDPDNLQSFCSSCRERKTPAIAAATHRNEPRGQRSLKDQR